MIRKVTHIRVTPRRKGHSRSAGGSAPEVLSTALSIDQVDLHAQLHEQAAQSVTTTLTRMQQRTQQAVRTTPELEPFLTAYFKAASSSLLQNTLALLDDQPVSRSMLQPRHTPAPARRRALLRFISGRVGKEEHDGQA